MLCHWCIKNDIIYFAFKEIKVFGTINKQTLILRNFDIWILFVQRIRKSQLLLQDIVNECAKYRNTTETYLKLKILFEKSEEEYIKRSKWIVELAKDCHLLMETCHETKIIINTHILDYNDFLH